jgi:hypothetical protein
MGFELTIPVSERAKTVLALNRAANVIGFQIMYKNWGCIILAKQNNYNY